MIPREIRARHEAFGIAAQVHVDAVAIDTLDHARDELIDAILVGVDHLRAFGFAHLLHDDLLGLLRGDTAEGHRFHGFFDEAADFRGLVHVQRVFEAQLALRRFHFARVVGEHLPAAERVVVTRLAVDRNAHFPVFAVLLARGRRQRRLERAEDDFLVDALLVRNCVDHQQDFFVHLMASRPITRSLRLPTNRRSLREPRPKIFPLSTITEEPVGPARSPPT
jgi:hypothetical protein